jgi:membrane dipeptidase
MTTFSLPANYIWDAHSGFEAWPHTDLSQLSIWRDAGVDFISVNVGYDLQKMQDTVAALAAFRRFLHASEVFVLVGNTQELSAAHLNGKTAVAFDLEGVNVMNKSLDLLYLYHELGVRQVALAYNRNSDAGGGCHDDDEGLTSFGRDAIRLMNEIGVVVDCSHCGYRTTMEAIDHSSEPVVFSHSNPRALCDHERNIRDEQALACAARGGVVGINGISLFLGDDTVSTAAMVDHAKYWIDLLGPQHVGIGLDYFFEQDGSDEHFSEVLAANADYWPTEQYPGGQISCARPQQLSALGAELQQSGMQANDVSNVMGGNFARIAHTVWK